MKKFIVFLTCLIAPMSIQSQTVIELMNQVDKDTLVKVMREFSGEDATVVNGSTVTLLNRHSASNDLAADYIKQKFAALDNITVQDIAYSANGRNIVATQLGKTNPNNIYIICAHYDTVANYCADDNASGTTAVLETARILSTQCTENTIIYALWDEEEQGLIGADNYADAAQVNGDNILGVYNMDMMAYDNDGDNVFDIDVRNIAGSLSLKDDLLAVLSTTGLSLTANVVNPGTLQSDHAPFWSNGYPAMLVGESWDNNDQTPNYHTANDRFSDLDMDYFNDLTKLALAFMATKGNLSPIDNTVSVTTTTLTANQTGATYQWLDCNNNDTPILSETGQSFTPSANGNYAVQVTVGSNVEISNCVNFQLLNNKKISKEDIEVFPNPVKNVLYVNFKRHVSDAKLSIVNVEGKTVMETMLLKAENDIKVSALANGVYFANIKTEGEQLSFKIVKE